MALQVHQPFEFGSQLIVGQVVEHVESFAKNSASSAKFIRAGMGGGGGAGFRFGLAGAAFVTAGAAPSAGGTYCSRVVRYTALFGPRDVVIRSLSFRMRLTEFLTVATEM